MMPNPSLKRFSELWGEIADLERTQQILQWDQETMMPDGGHGARRSLLATLAATHHRLITSTELSDAVEEAMATTDTASVERRQLEAARHEIDRAAKMPEALVAALAEAASDGILAWRKARAQESFTPFAPALTRMLALRREEAAALDVGEHPYDSLLDQYEPGVRTAELVPLFDELAPALARVVARVVDSGIDIDEAPARGDFPQEAQRTFGRWVAEAIGFDFERGRLDLSIHPFCSGFAPGDVRITWRHDPEDFRPAVFGIMHEAGHGMYEQGLPADFERTPLGFTRSMGVHESQSRLWENHVGRHSGFWHFALPRFRESFPAWQGDHEGLWRTLHKVVPSLIRVEADEVTYSLHILVRFRLELALLTGELEVEGLPDAWDAAYEELLGLRPGNVVEGVLQDIHWAEGLLGYFPTYTLGSLLSAQLFETAERELGGLEPRFRDGEYAPLLDWLRTTVHRHGSRYTAAEITEQATGAPLSSAPFLRYVDDKLERVYGIV
jgi:carboxypeptidase Taq